MRALPLAVVAALTCAAPASATVTTTSITSPADGTTVVVRAGSDMLTLAGSAPGAANGDKVDIWCLNGTSEDREVAPDVSVSSAKFTADRPSATFRPGWCTLMAVKDGLDPRTDDATGFGRSLVSVEYREDYRTSATAAGSPDVPMDFYISHRERRGGSAYDASGSCGLCGGRLFYEETKTESEQIFYVGGYFDQNEDAPQNRPALRVDGHNAWGSSAEYVDVDPGPGYSAGSELTGVPPLTYSVGGAGTPDEPMTLRESSDVVRCAGGDPWPVSASACDHWTGAGLRHERETVTSDGGTRVTMTDVFHSTDGAEHAIDMHVSEEMERPDAGFQHPWAGSGYATHTTGDTVPGTSAPVTMYVRTKNDEPDGSALYAQGVIVYDRPIGEISFVQDKRMLIPVALTVPAGGSVTFRHVYAMARTRAALEQTAAQVEDAFVAPTLEITGPAEGATFAVPQIGVTGTVRDNKGVAALRVNGADVPVSADGTWSTQVTLAPGANTIRAIATDTGGNEVSAQRSVTYAPPLPAPPPADVLAPTLSAVSLTAKTFRVASGPTAVAAATKRGTSVRYTLSEPAKVSFAISRATKGRRVAGKCRKATRKNRRKRACTRYVKAGRTITRTSPAGASRLRFTGRIGAKKLAPGRYRMAIVATDAAGNASKPRRLSFRIVRR